jgi:hypothetical protein
VAFYYPPDPAIGAVRVGALAKHLAAKGHNVHVLSAARRDLTLNAGGAARVNWRETRSLRVVTSRIEGASAGQPNHCSQPKNNSPLRTSWLRNSWICSTWKRIRTQGSFAWRVNRKLRAELIEFPDGAVGWIKPAMAMGTKIARTESVELVLASGPPFSSFLVSKKIASRLDIPWAADYRDLWTYGDYYPNFQIRRKIDRRLENRLLKTAKLVTTVSDVLTSEMTQRFGGCMETISNGADEWNSTALSGRQPLSGARVNLVYVGSELYEGKRSPELLFQAAMVLGLTLSDIRFHFVGGQGGEIQRNMEALASSYNVTELVEFTPLMPRAECMEVQSRADALMLLLWNDPRDAGTLSGKIFEYIAVHRPIVMIGYPDGEASKLIKKYSLGWVISNEASAKEFLEELLNQKTSSALAPDIPIGRTQDLSREKSLVKWESALNKIRSVPMERN